MYGKIVYKWRLCHNVSNTLTESFYFSCFKQVASRTAAVASKRNCCTAQVVEKCSSTDENAGQER
jgi:hypothetical protein